MISLSTFFDPPYPLRGNYEATLAAVRELSENATLRPPPRKLRCLPFQERIELQPLPAWKARKFIADFSEI